MAKAGDQELPTYWAVDDAFAKTCLNKKENKHLKNIAVLPLNRQNRIPSLLDALLKLRVGRLLVEGGPNTIQHFVEGDTFDEYRQWKSTVIIGSSQLAIPAAKVPVEKKVSFSVGKDVLTIGRNMPICTNC